MTFILAMLMLINSDRPANAPLATSTDLQIRAQNRAEYLCNAPFSHDNFRLWFGTTLYGFEGENLAKGYTVGNTTNAEEVNAAFMASPEHRANILKPEYKAVGIGNACGITVELFADKII